MQENRFQQLTNAGYSKSQIRAVTARLPEELLRRIEDAETPNEAQDLLREGLAESKAEVEGLEE